MKNEMLKTGLIFCFRSVILQTFQKREKAYHWSGNTAVRLWRKNCIQFLALPW